MMIGNRSCWLCLLLALAGVPADAHFLVLRPSHDVVSPGDPRTIGLQLLFTHPMQQGPVMELARPRRFGVLAHGKQRDLLNDLQAFDCGGRTAYRAAFRLDRPGDHVFFCEPAPYWEPAERKLIVHYTKVVVDYLHAEDGWDALVGLPVEIEPLARPYGLWTGNSFRGIVRYQGKPLPFARIEVEYDNAGGRVRLPNDAFITQTLKADAQGVFSYSMPRAGWWGFAALLDGPEKMQGPEGRDVDVELGGLMWVNTVDMK